MSAGHYENFPVASLLVPRPLRVATLAIYRFARTADDIADEGDAAPAARLSQLRRLQDDLDRIASGGTPDAEPCIGLAPVITTHALPLQPFYDLLSAFSQDVSVVRYETEADLLDYCRRSANPIGRLLLHLYGVSAPERARDADAICTALQLTNFWQDIASDWRRGRVYLPREHLQRFGIDESTIGHAPRTAAWRAVMRFEVARTRALLESGRPLTGALPWRLRMELCGVLAGANAILDRIEAVDGDVFRHRPELRGIDWLRIAASAVLPARDGTGRAARERA